jgi:hypothetical protein
MYIYRYGRQRNGSPDISISYAPELKNTLCAMVWETGTKAADEINVTNQLVFTKHDYPMFSRQA